MNLKLPRYWVPCFNTSIPKRKGPCSSGWMWNWDCQKIFCKWPQEKNCNQKGAQVKRVIHLILNHHSVFLGNKSLHQAFTAKPMKPNHITRPQWVDEILFLHKFCCMENVWKLSHLTRYCGAFHHQTSNQLQTRIVLNAYILNTTT